MHNLEEIKKQFLSEIPNFKEQCLKLIDGDLSKMDYKG